MHDYAEDFRERVRQHPESYIPQFLDMTKVIWELDNLYQVNVIAFAAEKGATEDPSRRQKIRDLLSKLPTKSVLITNWNTKVSSYDVAHFIHGRPVDKEEGTETLVIYQWTSITLNRNQNQQDKIVDALWKIGGRSEQR